MGATSLHTTVEDMARWDRNFYTAEVGGAELVGEMHRRGILRSGDTISYALGLSHGSYRGLPTVGHGGADAGYRSQFLRFPEQDLSLAVLCNFPSSSPGTLARRVADIVLERAFPGPLPEGAMGDEEEEPEPDPVALSTEELARLEGFYVRDDHDTPTSIRNRDGHLFIGGRRVLHQGDWSFRPESGSGTVSFRETADGSIAFTGPNGRSYARHAEVEPTPADLQPYVGLYWSEELGVEYEARLEEDRLFFTNRKTGQRFLNPTFRDGFSGSGSGVIFTRNPKGDVDGFTISSGRVWKVRFRRLEGPYPG